MTVQLHLDKTVYSLVAVQKAAYRFIDRLTILISQQGDVISCDIEPTLTLKDTFEYTLARFKQELLDQQLRIQIRNETEDVRNLILSLAFARSGLQA